MLLLALLVSCEKEENNTEFSGKVIDLDTNQPVANTKIELIVGNGLAPNGNIVSPEVMNGNTNSKGEYKFLKAYRQEQTVYRVIPEKVGYIEVKDGLGKLLKPNERNVHDIGMAKGSYLRLNIKNSATAPDKSCKIMLSYPRDITNSPSFGIMHEAEIIEYNSATTPSEVVRGFYFKRTPYVKVDWEVTVAGAIENKSITVPLVEYDTAQFDIIY